MWAENKVRIVDIAEELGLSTATVSNVLHGKTDKISARTVKRVQEKLEERGYIPNMAATLLAQNNSRIIGVVIKDHEKYEGRLLTDPFIASSLNDLCDEIEANGWFMMVKKARDIMEAAKLLKRMGRDPAAMSMTGPVQGLFIGALSGISQAAGILMGKRLGAGEFDEAYGEAKKLVGYGAAGSLLLAAGLILLRGPYVSLYRVEPYVRRTAQGLLLAFAILSPVKVSNMILGGGVLRSGGRTACVMVIDAVGTWLVGVPLGLITAFLFHLPIFWVYFILSQEELVRLGLSAWVFRHRGWMRSISK